MGTGMCGGTERSAPGGGRFSRERLLNRNLASLSADFDLRDLALCSRLSGAWCRPCVTVWSKGIGSEAVVAGASGISGRDRTDETVPPREPATAAAEDGPGPTVLHAESN